MGAIHQVATEEGPHDKNLRSGGAFSEYRFHNWGVSMLG